MYSQTFSLVTLLLGKGHDKRSPERDWVALDPFSSVKKQTETT